MFKKKHEHDWNTIAFDPGYYTMPREDDDDKQFHHLEFQECGCGERRLRIDANFGGQVRGWALQHSSIVNALHKWKEKNELQLTNEAEVFSYYYTATSPDHYKVKTWEFQPLTGVQQILRKLSLDEEFKELRKNKLVDDAFGELEIAVKLHSNID